MHPRNRHQGHYDFGRLVRASTALKPFLIRTPAGTTSIDFADPRAVRALNRAVLAADYGIAHWDIPAGYLCPPIPGRADYVHGVADLLAGDCGGEIPRGAKVRLLDIGTGANLIYPLLAQAEYGWHAVGSDIDPTALAGADAIVRSNGLLSTIELRHQHTRGQILPGIVAAGESFAVSVCNPPFHASARDAAQGNQRKRANLGQRGRVAPLNFGGRDGELWCPGGESRFIARMIGESAGFADQVLWFTSLVARSAHLPRLQHELRRAGAQEVREIAMSQGQKQSRFLAWSFFDAEARSTWWHRHSAPGPARPGTPEHDDGLGN